MIRVNDDYIITVDSMSYTLMRDVHRKTKRRDRSGEEVEVDAFLTLGYYSNLRGAIEGAIKDMNARELSEGVHELKEALEIVTTNNRRFSELLEKVLAIEEA